MDATFFSKPAEHLKEPPIIGWKVVLDEGQLVLVTEFSRHFLPERSMRYTSDGRYFEATRIAHTAAPIAGLPDQATHQRYSSNEWTPDEAQAAAASYSQLKGPPQRLAPIAQPPQIVLASGRVGLPSATHVTTTWVGDLPKPLPRVGIVFSAEAADASMRPKFLVPTRIIPRSLPASIPPAKKRQAPPTEALSVMVASPPQAPTAAAVAVPPRDLSLELQPPAPVNTALPQPASQQQSVAQLPLPATNGWVVGGQFAVLERDLGRPLHALLVHIFFNRIIGN